MRLTLIHIILFGLPLLVMSNGPSYLEVRKSMLDSLQTAWQITTNDTLRVQLAEGLSDHYLELDRDSVIYYCEQRVILSRKIGHKIWEASAYNTWGYTLYHRGDFIEALRTLQKALKLAEDPSSAELPVEFLKDTACNPDYDRLSTLAHIHHNMGHLYGGTGNFEKQISSYQRTKELAEDLNYLYLLSLVNMNMGHAYFLGNKLDTALNYEYAALYYADESGIIDYKGVIVSEIGNILNEKSGLNAAREYFLEGIQLSRDQGNFNALGRGYFSYARALVEHGRIDSGLYYARKAYGIYMSLDELSGKMRAQQLISGIFKQKNEADSALYYLELSIAARDSLNNVSKIKQFETLGFSELLRVQELEKERILYRNKIRMYTLLIGIVIVLFVAFLLFRNSRNRKKANVLLRNQRNELQSALSILKSTQTQLIHSEKMASLGELTAGIAHEIQNPLNFVTNFSEVSVDLTGELVAEAAEGNMDELSAIAGDLRQNLEKITDHGTRASNIVKGMLEHSRTGNGQKELTNINAMADEYLRLAYHGLKAKDKTFDAGFSTNLDESIPEIKVVHQDIGRVLLNLINNSFYAVSTRTGSGDTIYSPEVVVSTKLLVDKVEIRVTDNGGGIPPDVLDKIFQPFFTTKPPGEGTGLGLSMSYDIIKKGHGWVFKIENREGEGVEFIIELPVG